MFSDVKKFDGKNISYLAASEYLQMSGWAGWRGKDDKGTVLLYFDKANLYRYPGIEEELEKLMNKSSEKLMSKYRLTYKIIMYTLFSNAQPDPKQKGA